MARISVSQRVYDSFGELGHTPSSVVDIEEFGLSDRVSRMILESNERELEEQATELAAEIANRVGTDDSYDDGAVILFHRNFSHPGSNKPDYLYAALKAGGSWFITGRSNRGYRITWNQLLRDFLVPAFVETGQLWVASEWTAL